MRLPLSERAGLCCRRPFGRALSTTPSAAPRTSPLEVFHLSQPLQMPLLLPQRLPSMQHERPSEQPPQHPPKPFRARALGHQLGPPAASWCRLRHRQSAVCWRHLRCLARQRRRRWWWQSRAPPPLPTPLSQRRPRARHGRCRHLPPPPPMPPSAQERVVVVPGPAGATPRGWAAATSTCRAALHRPPPVSSPRGWPRPRAAAPRHGPWKPSQRCRRPHLCAMLPEPASSSRR
mmetsp:Transcript_45940/g.147637  ORF Transcript_45940/g.147637 Transcript_45940/m.147637 type:complete len:233 (-) Transcript_45940:3553-4251(-)